MDFRLEEDHEFESPDSETVSLLCQRVPYDCKAVRMQIPCPIVYRVSTRGVGVWSYLGHCLVCGPQRVQCSQ